MANILFSSPVACDRFRPLKANPTFSWHRNVTASSNRSCTYYLRDAFASLLPSVPCWWIIGISFARVTQTSHADRLLFTYCWWRLVLHLSWIVLFGSRWIIRGVVTHTGLDRSLWKGVAFVSNFSSPISMMASCCQWISRLQHCSPIMGPVLASHVLRPWTRLNFSRLCCGCSD